MTIPSIGRTAILWDWMGCSSIVGDTGLANQPILGLPVVSAPNSPYAANTTPVYTGKIVDPFGNGVPAANIETLTLGIYDTLTGNEILAQTDILNTGRGAIDDAGNLTITLEASPDTDLSGDPGVTQIQRSMVIDWEYDNPGPTPPASSGTGRHQVDFIVAALAGP